MASNSPFYGSSAVLTCRAVLYRLSAVFTDLQRSLHAIYRIRLLTVARHGDDRLLASLLGRNVWASNVEWILQPTSASGESAARGRGNQDSAICRCACHRAGAPRGSECVSPCADVCRGSVRVARDGGGAIAVSVFGHHSLF